jgi:hypothetical protein
MYTVGVDPEGNTTLKVEASGGVVTMTLNHAAVIQMIKLLAATLDNIDVKFEHRE